MNITAGELDTLFMALSHDKRRDMVHELSLQPSTVQHLAVNHGLSLPAIHKHVRLLEKAKLLVRKKVGRTNFVAINREGLQKAQAWSSQFRADWGNDQETLENYITKSSGAEKE